MSKRPEDFNMRRDQMRKPGEPTSGDIEEWREQEEDEILRERISDFPEAKLKTELVNAYRKIRKLQKKNKELHEKVDANLDRYIKEIIAYGKANEASASSTS